LKNPECIAKLVTPWTGSVPLLKMKIIGSYLLHPDMH
jgi:hypothetical protein